MYKLFKKNGYYILYNTNTDKFCIESDMIELNKHHIFDLRKIDENLFKNAEFIISVDDIDVFKELIPEEFI